MKKYIRNTLIFLLCMPVLWAQGIGGVYLSFGGVMGRLKNDGFESFVRTYNELNQSFLTSPLPIPKYGFGTSFNVGGIVFLNNLALKSRIRFRSIKKKFSARYNEEQRDFILKISNNFQIDLQVGRKFGQVTALVGVGLAPHRVNLESYYIYANGVKSYGMEKVLNGVYRSFGMGGNISASLLFFPTDEFFVYINWEKYGILPGTIDRLGDGYWAKSWQSVIGESVELLPADYKKWKSLGGSDYDYENQGGKFVEGTFTGGRLELGIGLLFNSF